MMKSKLVGLSLIGMSLVSLPIFDMDATATALLLPLGVACLFLKEDEND